MYFQFTLQTLYVLSISEQHIMHNKVRVLETAQKPDLLHAPAQCGAALALNDVDVAGGAAVDGQEARHVRRHALHEAVQLVRRHRRKREVITVTVPTLVTADKTTALVFHFL